jgi:hypothetical protein
MPQSTQFLSLTRVGQSLQKAEEEIAWISKNAYLKPQTWTSWAIDGSRYALRIVVHKLSLGLIGLGSYTKGSSPEERAIDFNKRVVALKGRVKESYSVCEKFITPSEEMITPVKFTHSCFMLEKAALYGPQNLALNRNSSGDIVLKVCKRNLFAKILCSFKRAISYVIYVITFHKVRLQTKEEKDQKKIEEYLGGQFDIVNDVLNAFVDGSIEYDINLYLYQIKSIQAALLLYQNTVQASSLFTRKFKDNYTFTQRSLSKLKTLRALSPEQITSVDESPLFGGYSKLVLREVPRVSLNAIISQLPPQFVCRVLSEYEGKIEGLDMTRAHLNLILQNEGIMKRLSLSQIRNIMPLLTNNELISVLEAAEGPIDNLPFTLDQTRLIITKQNIISKFSVAQVELIIKFINPEELARILSLTQGEITSLNLISPNQIDAIFANDDLVRRFSCAFVNQVKDKLTIDAFKNFLLLRDREIDDFQFSRGNLDIISTYDNIIGKFSIDMINRHLSTDLLSNAELKRILRYRISHIDESISDLNLDMRRFRYLLADLEIIDHFTNSQLNASLGFMSPTEFRTCLRRRTEVVDGLELTAGFWNEIKDDVQISARLSSNQIQYLKTHNLINDDEQRALIIGSVFIT